jgi:hypothetical protein
MELYNLLIFLTLVNVIVYDQLQFEIEKVDFKKKMALPLLELFIISWSKLNIQMLDATF